jgi:hypothetical protein
MSVSAYHFAIPSGPDGATQAQYAFTNAGDYKAGGHNLPMTLDLEMDPYSPKDGLNQCYSLTPSAMVSWISAFVAKATALTGAAPIIYTPQAWWDTCTASSTAFGAELLWVPAYQLGSPGVLPASWNTWTFWQYTASGTVPGITGNVDLDYWDANPVAVAALGTDGVPYAQAPQLGGGTAWQSLGGHLSAVPAVAALPVASGATLASPLVIAPGTNHLLYIRGVTGAWVRLGPNDASCLSVAAAVTGSVLQLACETLTHGLSYDTAVIPASGLPSFTSKWRSLGGTGTLTAGPAVARVNGALTFFVTATDGKVHTRTTTSGFTTTGWACLGQPAAAVQASTATTWFACQGAGHGLWDTSNAGTGWGPLTQQAGTLAAGPGLAATTGALVVLLEGTSHNVYEGSPGSAYAKLGTLTVTGVQAAALN